MVPVPRPQSRTAVLGCLLLSIATGAGCGSGTDQEPAPPVIGPALHRESPTAIPFPSVRFTDITRSAGIRFHHTNGAFGKKLLPETMGSGVAFLDFDNDGRQDILFVNSCFWPGHEDEQRPKPTLALYRNKGDGTFEA